MALEQELETFRRELPRLLREGHRGKYALIHEGEVNSIWGTLDDGLSAGYERFGLKAFLVKEITDHEEPEYFSRNVTRCHS